MIPALAIVASVAVAAASTRAATPSSVDAPPPIATEDAPARSVVLLPLVPEPDGPVTALQAAGVTAQLRTRLDALAQDGTVALKRLSTSADDEDQRARCGDDLGCYGALAAVRGADLLVFGVVRASSGGLLAQVTVVEANGTASAGAASALLRGASDDEARIDRLWRAVDGRAVAPVPFAALQPGDEGTESALGLPEPIRTGALEETPSPAPPWGLLLGVGGGAAALGLVAGAGSLWLSQAVEERARDQQLVFPRDTPLIVWGNALAWTANVLVGAGAAAAATGGVFFALEDRS